MAQIWVTGDIHGNPKRLSSAGFPEQKDMTKDDVVIILGDFGLVWDYRGQNREEKYWLDWLEEKPFTTVFVDGNHENYDRLLNYPVKKWNGGLVHEIRPSVLHLMRGEVFNIDGDKFFAFGGASSHDIDDGVLEPGDPRIDLWKYDYNRLFRVNHQSWWAQELPSEDEIENGLQNLNNSQWKVDFVLTHSPTASVVALMGHGMYDQDILTEYLESLRPMLEYKRWLFGHFHQNRAINDKDICLYEQIVRIH